jgi:mono/diheme cytochrome c family protein
MGVALVASTRADEQPKPTLDQRLSAEFAIRVRPFLTKYCFECHNVDGAEAGVDLSMYKSLIQIREAESQWSQIRGLIRMGAMPPPDHDEQPSEAEREAAAEWVNQALTAVDCSVPNPPAPITVRRLNRFEYDNTVRDLLGLDASIGSPSNVIGFVSDDVGNGFDNQGEVLSLSPLILEKYSQAAEWLADKAVTTRSDLLRVQTATSEGIPVGTPGRFDFLFADGEYKIEVRMRTGYRSEGKLDVEIRFDGHELAKETIEKKTFNFTKKLDVKAGKRTLEIFAPYDGGNTNFAGGSEGLLYIDQVVVTGPAKGNPPRPLSHQKIIVAEPNDKVIVEEAATKIMKELVPRAFRRPVSEEERGRYVKIIVDAQRDGWSFIESVQFGLQALLVSPEFLFRIETNHRSATVVTTTKTASNQFDEPVDPFDVASRLSFFLWSSMPDDELFRSAARGELAMPEQLQNQIDRMLADPKSDALIHGFFAQWLGLRNLAGVSVDDREFPIWSDKLSEALSKETFLFCREMLHRGSLKDVLTADYSFMNPRLADFYQVKFDGLDPRDLYVGSTKGAEFSQRNGRYRDEDKWIRVSLPETRRGLLTHASVLALTSNPTRTSPVKRGKWVLDNILGDPPPPAPPSVPSLEESVGDNSKLPLRKQLEMHRTDAGCASCHKVLDPIGLGLENFDAIGQWRMKDEGKEIVAEGELVDGRKFSGPRELLKLLESDKPKIARHFAAQLLTYALGRGLVRGDGCTIDRIAEQALRDDLEIKSFIRAVVNSYPFLNNGLQ